MTNVIYHSTTCLQHNPAQEFGGTRLRTYPEQPDRVTAIVNAGRKHGYQIRSPKEYDQQWISKIHHQDYVNFVHDIASVFPEDRNEVAPTAFNRGGIIREESSFYAKIGQYFFDPATPLVQNTGLAAMAAVNCALNAVDDLHEGTTWTAALGRPPGHHAMANCGGGYCIFNNVAIAANYLSSKGRSVSILDLDFHHGNGTQEIFYNRDDVQYVSIHADPLVNYPFYWGFADQQGQGDGYGFTRNLPVPNHISSRDYLNHLDLALDSINEYDPEVLLVSMGFDCHIDDPIAGLSLTTSSYTIIGEKLQPFPKIGIILEGGYATQVLGPSFVNLLDGLRS